MTPSYETLATVAAVLLGVLYFYLRKSKETPRVTAPTAHVVDQEVVRQQRLSRFASVPATPLSAPPSEQTAAAGASAAAPTAAAAAAEATPAEEPKPRSTSVERPRPAARAVPQLTPDTLAEAALRRQVAAVPTSTALADVAPSAAPGAAAVMASELSSASEASVAAPEKRKASESPPPETPPEKRKAARKAESREAAEHASLSRVFGVCLTPNVRSLYYLPALAAELTAQGLEPRLREADVDSILLERLPSLLQGLQWPTYLIQCFGRALEERSKGEGGRPPEWLATVERAIVSQLGLHVSEHPQDLATLLLSQDVPAALLAGIASEFPEEVPALTAQIIRPIHQRIVQGNLLQPVLPPLKALLQLSAQPGFVAQLVALPQWCPAGWNGRQLQMMSLLGPCFQYTPIYMEAPAVAEHFFGTLGYPLTAADVPSLESGHSLVRMQLSAVQALLTQLMKNVLKSGQREPLLSWLAAVCRSNADRAKMRADPFPLATDGFLANLCAVLLGFCAPFTDGLDPAQIAKIDPRFVAHGRLALADETHFAMSSDEFREWAAENALDAGIEADGAEPKERFKVATEAMYMTAYALHIGWVRSLQLFEAIGRQRQQLQERRAPLAEQQARGGGGGMAAAALHQLDEQLKRVQTAQLSLESHLLAPDLCGRLLSFYAFLASWLLHLANPADAPLPLRPPVPGAFAAQPEFFVEDIVESCLFLIRYRPKDISEVSLSRLVSVMVAMIGRDAYFRNHYIKAKMVEFLCELFPRPPAGEIAAFRLAPLAPGRWSGLFMNNRVVLEQLVPALVKLYVDIETTGRHAQFYEKFSSRRAIAELLRNLRDLPEHAAALKSLSREPVFTRFVSLMINDAMFLVDEVLEKLRKVREIELAMQDRAAWARQDEETRQDQEQLLQADIHQARMFSQLANETIALFHHCSFVAPQAFLVPEMVGRVAEMLLYFVREMAGPKFLDLQVREADRRFEFDPVRMLGFLAIIFTRFARRPAFVQAVAADASFSADVLRRVAVLLGRTSTFPPMQLEAFERFIGAAEKALLEVAQDEAELGDIPDEFMDPIACVLMTDPVTLPTSGQTMDRAVITRHLLSDQKDPFNRQPLAVDMLQPNTALKEQIEEFRRSKKTKR